MSPCTHLSLELRVLSLRVGVPTELRDARGRTWMSAIAKREVSGAVELGPQGLCGDGHADTRHHGGPEKALLASPIEHLVRWRAWLGRSDLGPGAFGENLTLAGAVEHDVCIGDVFEAGEVRVQVSQPRLPCWKQGRRWDSPELPAFMQSSGMTGWYFRVLRGGQLHNGARLTLVDRPRAPWSVTRANGCLHGRPVDGAAALELAEIAELSEGWRSRLRRLAVAGEAPDEAERLYSSAP